MNVGFIGIGAMGLPMARNLLRAGHHVIAFNRTRERAEVLRAEGATVADSPAHAARNAEVLVTMLSDDKAVEDVILSEGAIALIARNNIHLGMSTISVDLSRRLSGCHGTAGHCYVSAPVFGRPEAAAQGKLWVVAAGGPEQIERCRPVLEPLSRVISVVGQEPWKANLVKLAGNFMIASMLEALGESFALIRKSGLQPAEFLEIINGALFQSPIYGKYGALIAERGFEPAGFRLKLGLKDARLLLEAAEECSLPMPLASVIRDHFLSAIALGLGEADWAALAEVAAFQAGAGGAGRG